VPTLDRVAEPLCPALETADIAALLKCDTKTVERMARSGRLKAFKLGGRWRYRRQDIEAFMAGDGKPAAAQKKRR
jgi:excisionase family DNA binding protein